MISILGLSCANAWPANTKLSRKKITRMSCYPLLLESP
jgi:hypothetical protein